ncbi:hypothetical protein X975_07265, partial [Stegodyphus mimosarum]
MAVFAVFHLCSVNINQFPLKSPSRRHPFSSADNDRVFCCSPNHHCKLILFVAICS